MQGYSFPLKYLETNLLFYFNLAKILKAIFRILFLASKICLVLFCSHFPAFVLHFIIYEHQVAFKDTLFLFLKK